MNTKGIKERYDNLKSTIEDAEMYDGRGEYNGYVCEHCNYITATIYKDKGVTPFVIICERCGKTAIHRITTREMPPTLPHISKVKVWVRPTFEQLIKMKESTIQHVLDGGLVFEDELEKI